MRAILTESVWRHELDSSALHAAIDDGSLKGVKEEAKKILESCRQFFDCEEDEYECSELEELIEDFENVDETEEDIDFLLDRLYDFCDENRIFLKF